MRGKIIVYSGGCLFIFLLGNLLNLQIIHGRKYRNLSEKNCIRLIPQPGCRGIITDSTGAVIAGNRLSYDVVILPRKDMDLETTFARLAPILEVSSGDLKRRFRTNYVAESVPVTLARSIDLKKAIAVEEKKLELEGVMVQANAIRDYPLGKLACHVIGYINQIDRWRLTKLADYGYKTKDMVGFGGVEERYDYFLRQEDGGLSVEVDHRGRFIRAVGFRPPKSGKDLQLTIDARVQKIAEEELSGHPGAVVIMDPGDGSVDALCSFPDFDPSVFVKRSNDAIEDLVSRKDAPFLNRSISSAYPPGSVFKPVVAYAALQTKKIDASSAVHCPGSLRVGNRDFKCWSTHQQQNVVGSLARSCDVFFYRAGLAVGPQVLSEFARRFGYGHGSGVELPYEIPGLVPSPILRKLSTFRKWFSGDTANFSIGQGELLTTPIQVCRMMAVLANGGKSVVPYVIKGIDGKDVSARHRKVSDLHLNRAALALINKGLREVVIQAEGTANMLSTLPVQVAGKTGTAQAGGDVSHGWFTAYFPYERPEYVMTVFLEKGGHGSSAAVVAGRIIQRMAEERLVSVPVKTVESGMALQ